MKVLRQSLAEIELSMIADVERRSALLEDVHRSQQTSAKNLLCYLSLRNRDIRSIQDQLHALGLSSLASSESHIHRQLQEVQMRLGRSYLRKNLNHFSYADSVKKINLKSKKLFGKKASHRIPYIMVTFDTSFADDLKHVTNLLRCGMNVARINCAHDDEVVWKLMIDNIRRAEHATGLSCKVYMDLAGPKLRTVLFTKNRQFKRMEIRPNDVVYLVENEADVTTKKTVLGCTLPGIVSQLKVGERVLIDDGLIELLVIQKRMDVATLAVKRVSSKKPFIKAAKGLNFPDSTLDIPSLTDFDRQCIPFIARHADLVGYSFVNRATDVQELQRAFESYTRKPHVILKIETPEAVNNLPSLLMQGMHDDVFGVMIARGDLAVEIGFERMSEIQDEILWICEAAHVPVIWATQVLDTMNKSGIATRSEVTDAAHSAMAECVMINKGEYIIEVIETLKDILSRTGGHHVKKRYTFRPLGIATRFMQLKSKAD